jgi:uncharacterized membrane protein
MNELWRNLAVVGLWVIHYLSTAVWVGVMLFNLIVNFPALSDRAKNPSDYAAAMFAQGKRAGPWLYIIIFLTLTSGWALSLTQSTIFAEGFLSFVLVKNIFLFLMVTLHLWGSFSLWPRIYFALDEERPKLFLRYQWAMAMSGTLGIFVISFTYTWRVFVFS